MSSYARAEWMDGCFIPPGDANLGGNTSARADISSTSLRAHRRESRVALSEYTDIIY
jgi:hypothetical protein